MHIRLRFILLAGLCLSACVSICSAQVHPRLLFGPEDIAAEQAKANRQPYQSIIEVMKHHVQQTGWAYTNAQAWTLAALYLYEQDESWAEKAALECLYQMASDNFAKASEMSIRRGYATIQVAFAYDYCYDSDYWANTVVPSGTLTQPNTTNTFQVPAKYVGMTVREAVSRALFDSAERLRATGGFAFPGDDYYASNWLGIRYGAAIIAYLASDEPIGNGLDAVTREMRDHWLHTFTTDANAKGWMPEGYGYNYFPARCVALSAVALARNGYQDYFDTYPGLHLGAFSILPGLLPIDFSHTGMNDNGATPWRGLRPDPLDDHNLHVGEGTPYLAFGLAYNDDPSDRMEDFDWRAGVRWMVDKYFGLSEDGGNETWDAVRGAGPLAMLYYDDSIPARNPAEVWGLTYYDPAYGTSIFRNQYGDTLNNEDQQDFVLQTLGNTRFNSGSHRAPDGQTIRLMGLGQHWIVGAGRTSRPTGQSQIYPGNPNDYSNWGRLQSLGSVTRKHYAHPQGGGYQIMYAGVSDLGVEDMTRRVLVDYSQETGANAFVIMADSSANGIASRLNIAAYHNLSVSGNTFTATSPQGHRMQGTVIWPENATITTGLTRRGGELQATTGTFSDNKTLDIMGKAGETSFLVALQVVESGKPMPQVEGHFHSDGFWWITAPNRTFSYANGDFVVTGWNPPEISIDTPVDNQQINTGQTELTVSGTALDRGGKVKEIKVYLNDELKKALTFDAETVNWQITLTGLSAQEHRLRVIATDNSGGQATTEHVFQINQSIPPASVVLDSHSEDTFLTDSTTVTLSGTAQDPDGTISRVEIWKDGQKLGDASYNAQENRWSYSVGTLPTGAHHFEVIAYDNSGAFTRSESVTLRSSILFSDIPFWGDAANYSARDSRGNNILMQLSNANITQSENNGPPEIHLREVNGDRMIAMWDNNAYLTLGDQEYAHFRLEYRARPIDPEDPTFSYNLQIGSNTYIEMAPINAQYDSRGYVRRSWAGTRVWENDSGLAGYIHTVEYDNHQLGTDLSLASTSHAGVLGSDWTHVRIDKYADRITIQVKREGDDAFKTIVDGKDARLRAVYPIIIWSRSNEQGGIFNDRDSRFYFDDIQVWELDGEGNVAGQSVGLPYVDWIATFSSLSTAQKARDADPDQDGMNNWKEFSFGGNPTQPDAFNPLRAETMIAGDQTWMKVAYDRPTERAALYEVEYTHDFSAWHPLPAAENTTPAGEAEDEETLSFFIRDFFLNGEDIFFRVMSKE